MSRCLHRPGGFSPFSSVVLLLHCLKTETLPSIGKHLKSSDRVMLTFAPALSPLLRVFSVDPRNLTSQETTWLLIPATSRMFKTHVLRIEKAVLLFIIIKYSWDTFRTSGLEPDSTESPNRKHFWGLNFIFSYSYSLKFPCPGLHLNPRNYPFSCPESIPLGDGGRRSHRAILLPSKFTSSMKSETLRGGAGARVLSH